MKIEWYGHACFRLTAENGTAILTDPCDASTGYTLENIEANAVTASHTHYDHNYFAAAAGDPAIITDLGDHEIGGVQITGFAAFHDDVGGQKRGSNTVYRFLIDGLSVVHAGDLGHLPDEALLSALGKVDVLLIPVGGTYTLDALDAAEAVRRFQPQIVIPMHYRTKALAFPLGNVDPFLKALSGYTLHRLSDSECTVSADTLGAPRALVLDYKR